jgi:diguanylate cyclase (GGDEF)-like protein
MEVINKDLSENKLFENLFDVIPFIVIVIDVKGYEIVFMNQFARQHYGNKIGQICYSSLYEETEPCLFCKIKELVTRDFKPNGNTFIWEHFNPVDDRWFQLQEKAISWPDGRTVKYTVSVDINQLKEIQNRLAEAHAELTFKNKALEEMIITDFLTKIFNRQKVEKDINVEVSRYTRYKRPLSIILLDIDKFKSINDTYGHNAGDSVLINLASIIKTNVRKIDLPGRWGGEEFMILCPETDIHGAVTLAENLRQKIEAHTFEIDRKVTSSFGVAQFKEGELAKDFIRRADDALYLAKENGRNRVEASG